MISHQHEFDKIISQCHPCDYLFIIYHNTRTNRNFVHTYHSHIYYTSTHCHFLTLQITVCLSCQTQQAMLCVTCCGKTISKKNSTQKFNKKIQKKNLNKILKNKIQKQILKNKSKKNPKKIQKKNSNFSKNKQNQFFFHKNKISTFFPHKICIVSHSSYHTRITLVVSHSHATSGGI